MGRYIAMLVRGPDKICATFREAQDFLWADFEDLCASWEHDGPPTFMSLAGLAGWEPPKPPVEGKDLMSLEQYWELMRST
jgi:hypothetical protein